jgi:cupin 2 domain-containing protein
MKRNKLKVCNIYRAPPGKFPGEIFSAVARAGKVEVEKIVSRGHRSPPGFWYDQDFDELVFLLRGAAVLRLAGRRAPLRLDEGDYVLIPARKRHRVEWTHLTKPTVWLAIKARRFVS